MPAGHLYCKLYTKHVFVACRMQLGVALVKLTFFTLLPGEIDFFSRRTHQTVYRIS